MFQSIYTTIISNIQKSLRKCSGWIIDSVKDHSINISKYKVHVDLLLMGEEGERHYVLIKYFNTFMYDYALDRGRRHFCRYFLQACSIEQRLKC